jgi:hypothetical protein
MQTERLSDKKYFDGRTTQEMSQRLHGQKRTIQQELFTGEVIPGQRYLRSRSLTRTGTHSSLGAASAKTDIHRSLTELVDPVSP